MFFSADVDECDKTSNAEANLNANNNFFYSAE